MKSLLICGFVEHIRHQPIQHAFRYPVTYYAFDLDELPFLGRRLPFFSHNRPNVVSLWDADYLDGTSKPIKGRLDWLLRKRSPEISVHRAVLVTTPRYWQRVFNPVSFHYAFDRNDRLIAVVAEVNNTFGERHVYLLTDRSNGTEGFPVRYESPKAFHVSPFNDMEGVYRFSFSDLQKEVDLRVELHKSGGRVFEASLTGRTMPLTAANHRRVILRHPLIPHLTLPRILWQAARLHFKGKLPVHKKPVPQSPWTIRKAAPSMLEKRFQKTILDLFRRLAAGRLEVTLPDRRTERFGAGTAASHADLRINHPAFFTRVGFGGETGFGEAYMEGLWDSDDPARLIALFIENREALSEGNPFLDVLQKAADRLRHLARPNTLFGARRNIHRHYDLSNDFFKCFLDDSMTYSCAVFEDPGDSLEKAQENKRRRILELAEIDASDHVLEIGCGWGGFAIDAAMKTGCRVTGITLSIAQSKEAQRRVRQAGLEDRVRILVEDYRTLRGRFDKIVSIEMLEAVGHQHYGAFFRACDRLLKPHGLLALQTIAIPDPRYDSYRKGCDWIQKHIFPGGMLPSLTALTQAAGTHSNLFAVHLVNIGPHYARTLREWRRRFSAHRQAVEDLGFHAAFIRKWIYYLCFCEAAFGTRHLNDFQMLWTRQNNRRLRTPPHLLTLWETTG